MKIFGEVDMSSVTTGVQGQVSEALNVIGPIVGIILAIAIAMKLIRRWVDAGGGAGGAVHFTETQEFKDDYANNPDNYVDLDDYSDSGHPDADETDEYNREAREYWDAQGGVQSEMELNDERSEPAEQWEQGTYGHNCTSCGAPMGDDTECPSCGDRDF